MKQISSARDFITKFLKPDVNAGISSEYSQIVHVLLILDKMLILIRRFHLACRHLPLLHLSLV
jgi:hypothetical protein